MKKNIMFNKKNESGTLEGLKQRDVVKRRRLRRKECHRFNMNRTCRFEELENRELLSATSIDVGAVYVEQLQEEAGDRFYIAWVGGESTTTLDSIVINLDKNNNNQIDSEEGYFDTTGDGMGVKGYSPFKVVEAATSSGITWSGLEVEDGGQVLKISFQNFHAGDVFCFSIDVDEYDLQSEATNNSGLFEGSEMGGFNTPFIMGSHMTATFTSSHFESETWKGMFLEDYDDFENQGSKRPDSLAAAFDDAVGTSSSTKLPYDADDNSSGLLSSGIYGTIVLTPKPVQISGYVYADKNVDCNYDQGSDDPLANVEVTLVLTETGETWKTYTGEDGAYLFGYDLNLAPGDYEIICQTDVIAPSGSVFYDFCAKGGEYGEKVDPLHIEVNDIPGGDQSTNNNFSKVLPGSLDGYVFEDLNNKDNKEPGEDGIANVEVELWKLQGDEWVYVESTITNDVGYYRFEIDGSYSKETNIRKNVECYYQIREKEVPPEYTDGTDYIGTLNGDVGQDIFDNILVGYDEHGYNYNFGELKLGSVSGNVFEDMNDNGIWDRDSEKTISNVKMELYIFDGGKYVTTGRTQMTNDEGFYKFDNLAIVYNYAVKEYQETAKYMEGGVEKNYDDGQDQVGSLGGDNSVDDYISAINVGWDQHGTDYNFGELRLGYIEGNVYEDLNDNGIYERSSGEKGIAEPVEIGLYRWDGFDYVFVRSTMTDENGFYSFDKLDINEEYAIQEMDQPSDYTDGKDTAGTINGQTVGTTSNDEWIREIVIGWADRGIEYNFGELKLGSIAGNVYEDLNNNGIFERETESGIGAVTVVLYRWTVDADSTAGQWTEIERQQTKDDGSYYFENLSIESRYAIREFQPENYSDGKDTVGTINGKTVGVATENDFIEEIPVKWDEHGIEYNFGELKLGSIAGNVYEDRNNNGIFERETESGIGAVTVVLYRWTIDAAGSTGRWAEVTRQQTLKDGSYNFGGLDINERYAVKELQPSDYTDGKDAVGTINGRTVGTATENDFIEDVDINWDEHGIEYNFGELKLGSVAGNVYNDINDNGIFERETEKGISEVTVILYRWTLNDGADGQWKEIARQQTKSDGSYNFSGLDINEKYAIREIQPTEWNDGKDTVGTINGTVVGRNTEDDFLEDVDIKWDEHGIEYNFGELKPIVPAEISGYVYVDVNKNGVMDSGEPGITNTVLTLWKYDASSGEYVLTGRTTMTNGSGYYCFDNLDPEQTYRITETQPSGYDDGQDSVGNLGGKAANDDLYDIYVDSGDIGTNYNFGEYIKISNPPPKDYYGTSQTPPIRIPNNSYAGGPGYSFNYIENNPIDMQHTISYYGGGGLPVSYSWHLSVLNGGYPRSVEALTSTAGYRAFLAGSSYMNVGYSQENVSSGEWMIRNRDGSVGRQYTFGILGSKPVIGDWNGDGKDSIGVFLNGRWYLDRNGDGKWDEDDLYAELGAQTDQAVTGDWDGDGKSDIGTFGPQWSGDLLAVAIEPGLPTDLNQYITVSRPKNIPPDYNKTSVGHRTMVHRNNGQMRLDLIDHVFEYGAEGDIAVAGDWNGDGISKIGVYRHGTWFLDVNGNGEWDEGDVMVENFTVEEGIPVVGDFNGDGIDDIAVFTGGQWNIDTSGDYKPDAHFTFGQEGDIPYAGDFDGDGTSEVGIYRPAAEADAAVVNK